MSTVTLDQVLDLAHKSSVTLVEIVYLVERHDDLVVSRYLAILPAGAF